MVEVSEFRKKKLLAVFNEFFDTNKNGVIDRGDFELSIQNVCLIRGWREDGPMHVDTKNKFFQIWDSLKVQAGVKYDTGEVSSESWYQLWADPMKHEGWQQAYMNFMFNLFDTSGDGVVDMFEFTSLCSCYGVDLQESRKAYLYLSNSNNVCVNKEYYSQLWKEYFYGDDPKAKGNCMFGKCYFE